MTYQDIGDFGVNNSADILRYVANVSPSFIPLTLFVLFLISLGSLYFGGRSISGRSDFSIAFAGASYLTMIIAFSMTLISGLINSYTVGIIVAVTIIATLFLFFGRED